MLDTQSSSQPQVVVEEFGTQPPAPPAAEPEAVKPEAAVEAEPTAAVAAEPKEEPKLVERFTALSRREKKLLEQEKTLKGRIERLSTFEEAEKLRESDPVAFIEKFGLSFENLAEAYLAKKEKEQPPTGDDRVQALEDKIKGYEDKAKEQLVEREQKYVSDQINAYKSRLGEHVRSAGERYELIQVNEAYDMVFDVVQEHYNQTGEAPEMDKACAAVESYLEKEARKILSAKKFAAKETPKEPSASQGSPTLTSRHSAVTTPASTTRLSPEESLKRAAAKLRWT